AMVGEARGRLDPLAVRRTLRMAGLRASRARSQNFLADPDVLQAILDLAAVGPGDRVLEIGPGLGILTGGLLDAEANVTAIELDRGLATYLRGRFAAELATGQLRLIEGDALDQPLLGLVEPPFEVVANLPYHVTSPTLHRFLGGTPRPARLVLMLQREVAERIAAPPGEMSYLAAFVQYHATVQIARRVPAAAFEPAPKVESAIVILEPRSDVPLGPPGCEAEDALWRLVQAGFRERRKMLRNVLSRQLPVEAPMIEAALDAAGIAGERRPQTLSVSEWLALLAALPTLRE
ncbi:MAG TPA: 16S rRNA (adenine(1518)-N(6)/adenine(1519)-N(6))-dimethyltransferase RsmA, partial [Candidatus Limnocylindrales bacterium]|nr:16S rRNA (adenine(1518)-N(6)/adenine(1519)-N(6))-dimethyltransferase RsmA [Candidatus Limnocylindrales bacterium]